MYNNARYLLERTSPYIVHLAKRKRSIYVSSHHPRKISAVPKKSSGNFPELSM